MRDLAFVVAAVLSVAPQVSYAQSLVDVSKLEAARRQALKEPAKVYTNEDLKPDLAPPASATPSEADTATTAVADDVAATPGAADAPAAAGELRDQAYWSGRMAAARATVERSRMFAAALQTRINSLTADAINRDDPAQRSVLEQDRTSALAELDRVNKELVEQTQAITDIETEARRAGVPAGWLR